MEKTLFFGDNLAILTGQDGQGQPYITSGSIDLVYLDPPFNSNCTYKHPPPGPESRPHWRDPIAVRRRIVWRRVGGGGTSPALSSPAAYR